MTSVVGFRSVKVLEDVSEGVIDKSGAYPLVEVTNGGASDVKFFPNDFPEFGKPANYGIPIKAGQTRTIPMAVYNFTASGPVTVVAYRM